MIILILATDMARHAEILDAFKQKVDNFDFSSEDHLTSLKMILIKACDVSNECRPFMISEHWVECLLEEYFQQVAGHYVSNYKANVNCFLGIHRLLYSVGKGHQTGGILELKKEIGCHFFPFLQLDLSDWLGDRNSAVFWEFPT